MGKPRPLRVRVIKILLVVLCLALAFGIVSFFADRAILAQTYARVPATNASLLVDYDDYADEYPREAVEFKMGDQTLRGYVYGPDNTRGLIIFRHGIFSQHQDYLALITAMVDKGWRVFAYDAIGCGESDGDDVIGLSQSALDVAAAVDYARESGMADGMKIGLWGHSWGGYGVAAALGTSADDVEACVTMSGFDTPLKVLEASSQSMLGPLAVTQTPTLWLNTVLTFGDDANHSASEAIESSKVDTLVIHGTNDQVVPYEGVSIASNISDAAALPENVSVTTLDELGRSEHNSYFYSRESHAYLAECSVKLAQLLDENDDNLDAPEVAAFMKTVDKRKANAADPELIEQIDAFFGAKLGA